MKKFVILVLVLVFAGAVLSRNAFAAEIVDVNVVNYKLPYPGMLPDSPVYFVKNLRDQIVGILVMGPVNKAFYNLLLSDKKLWAGQMLVESGNSNLGVATLLEAEEYFENALSQAYDAKKEGLDVSELGAKLLVSASKHAEVLGNVEMQVSGSDAEIVAEALAINEKSRSRALELTTIQ